mmetsp:Transcript_26270/g.34975  ORF Transcript_26270/g.34975 Transcript_26270/m.34975 type:complete len:86 (-) Transcript_26270:580-837(-)
MCDDSCSNSSSSFSCAMDDMDVSITVGSDGKAEVAVGDDDEEESGGIIRPPANLHKEGDECDFFVMVDDVVVDALVEVVAVEVVP